MRWMAYGCAVVFGYERSCSAAAALALFEAMHSHLRGLGCKKDVAIISVAPTEAALEVEVENCGLGGWCLMRRDGKMVRGFGMVEVGGESLEL